MVTYELRLLDCRLSYTGRLFSCFFNKIVINSQPKIKFQSIRFTQFSHNWRRTEKLNSCTLNNKRRTNASMSVRRHVCGKPVPPFFTKRDYFNCFVFSYKIMNSLKFSVDAHNHEYRYTINMY